MQKCASSYGGLIPVESVVPLHRNKRFWQTLVIQVVQNSLETPISPPQLRSKTGRSPFSLNFQPYRTNSELQASLLPPPPSNITYYLLPPRHPSFFILSLHLSVSPPSLQNPLASGDYFVKHLLRNCFLRPPSQPRPWCDPGRSAPLTGRSKSLYQRGWPP